VIPFLPPSALKRLGGKDRPRLTRPALLRGLKTMAAVAVFLGLVVGLSLAVLKL